jgi:chromosome segregation ATPase
VSRGTLRLPTAPHHPQEREERLVARESNLAATHEAVAAQQGAAQVEVARLQAAAHELNKQLSEAEADYVTGSERLAQLHREVRWLAAL